jgi:hypothetical protein
VNSPERNAPEEIEQVSYGRTGYETFEDEAEAAHEARERFRRRLLCVIRGRLRESAGLRWWIALLMAGCACLAWFLAEIPATVRFGSFWHSGLAVLATWPVYVLVLFLRAKAEGKRLDLAGHWDSLKTLDERGEFQDRDISEQIDRVVNKGWEATRYQGSNQGGGVLLGYLLLTIMTVGTWLIWDLLRMGPGLMAEIILDGVIVPAYPEIKERMPYEAWYKTAFINTGAHFAGAALCTVMLVTLWKFTHLPH